MLESQGKTVEEAINSGLDQLSLTKEFVDITVLDEGSKGFLGFGIKPARVLLTEKLKSQIEAQRRQEEDAAKRLEQQRRNEEKAQQQARDEARQKERDKARQEKDAEARQEKHVVKPPQNANTFPKNEPLRKKADRTRPDANEAALQKQEPPKKRPAQEQKAFPPPKSAQPSAQKPAQQPRRPVNDGGAGAPIPQEVISDATAYLDEIFKRMGVVASLTAEQADGGLRITAAGADAGTLIGYRGETLDALQYLVSLKVNRGEEGYQRVTLDAEHYRAKREETLVKLANRLAGKAVKSGKKVTLEPMNPYERRILHSALQQNNNVRTHSEGEEPYRRVVITPKRENTKTAAE